MASVLIVDWPNQDVPRELLAAGFDVFSANLAVGTASRYSVGEPRVPLTTDGAEVLPAQRDGDPPLVITRIASMPDHVDAVALYRPAAEHAGIAQRAVDLGARMVWVQTGTLADDARRIAASAYIAVIEEASINDAIHSLARLT